MVVHVRWNNAIVLDYNLSRIFVTFNSDLKKETFGFYKKKLNEENDQKKL